jgi:hypothetical protein
MKWLAYIPGSRGWAFSRHQNRTLSMENDFLSVSLGCIAESIDHRQRANITDDLAKRDS